MSKLEQQKWCNARNVQDQGWNRRGPKALEYWEWWVPQVVHKHITCEKCKARVWGYQVFSKLTISWETVHTAGTQRKNGKPEMMEDVTKGTTMDNHGTKWLRGHILYIIQHSVQWTWSPKNVDTQTDKDQSKPWCPHILEEETVVLKGLIRELLCTHFGSSTIKVQRVNDCQMR